MPFPNSPLKSPPKSPRKSPLKSPLKSPRPQKSPRKLIALKKVRAALVASTQDCNAFSLAQRGGTCYMAAATLMFGRVAIKYARVQAVRDYVRRSMANAHDDAQGPADNAACPNIPLVVRKYTWAMNNARNKEYSNHSLYPPEPQVEEWTKPRITPFLTSATAASLTEGGQAAHFAAALFWASGVPCTLYAATVKGRAAPTTYCSHESRYNEHIFGAIATVIRERLVGGVGFDVFDFALHNPSKGLAISTYRDYITQSMTLVHKSIARDGHELVCLFMAVRNKEMTKGHAISFYPCVKAGRLTWTMCNSWGSKGVCYLDVAAGIAVLEKAGFSMLTKASYVVRHKGAVEHSFFYHKLKREAGYNLLAEYGSKGNTMFLNVQSDAPVVRKHEYALLKVNPKGVRVAYEQGIVNADDVHSVDGRVVSEGATIDGLLRALRGNRVKKKQAAWGALAATVNGPRL